jgi:tetratricopeptide (TPR) repeat protein
MREQPLRFNRMNTAASYNREGALYMKQGAYREATFYLLSAVVCDPDCWAAFFNLGNCWVKMGEYEAAIWAYEQAVSNSDEYAPLFLNLGVAHCQQGNITKALPYLEQAWRIQPDNAVCSAALGFVCYKLDELGLAWHWYCKALKLEPEQDKYRESMQFIGNLITVAGL